MNEKVSSILTHFMEKRKERVTKENVGSDDNNNSTGGPMTGLFKNTIQIRRKYYSSMPGSSNTKDSPAKKTEKQPTEEKTNTNAATPCGINLNTTTKKALFKVHLPSKAQQKNLQYKCYNMLWKYCLYINHRQSY